MVVTISDIRRERGAAFHCGSRGCRSHGRMDQPYDMGGDIDRGCRRRSREERIV